MVVICKPVWVLHGSGSSIYSISVHPSMNTFVTGGGDHAIRLWDFPSVLEERDPEAMYDPLAVMKRHEGAVNCVRFSPNGVTLASASDDFLVLLWSCSEEG